MNRDQCVCWILVFTLPAQNLSLSKSFLLSVGEQDEDVATQSPVAALLTLQHRVPARLLPLPDERTFQPMGRVHADAAVSGVVDGRRVSRLGGPDVQLPAVHPAAAAAAAQSAEQKLQELPSET